MAVSRLHGQLAVEAVTPSARALELSDQLELFGDVGHGAPGCVGRRGRADVGNEVQQRDVLFVPDGADHRSGAAGHGPDQVLVGEREQVFQRAAAPRDDDHVDGGVGIQPLERPDDLLAGVHALDRDLLDPELHRRPAPCGVPEHVPFGRRVAAADQPDRVRQERQLPLALGGEQALGGQRGTQPFQSCQQFADADGFDLGGCQRE